MDELRLRSESGEPRIMVDYANLSDGVVDEAVGLLAEIIGRR